MPRPTDQYDFFVSYARADNQPAAPGQPGWISAFVEALVEQHRSFTGGRELKPFSDLEEIHSLDDWRHRLHDALAASSLFLAFLSPRYFASEWCRREWRAWIDLEIAKHILSSGVAPIYIIEVPGLDGPLSDEEVARGIAELCGVPPPRGPFLGETSPVIHQVRRRQFNAVQPFYTEGLSALRRADLRGVLEGLARDVDERVAFVRRAAESANTVPPYNKRFSGRLEELQALRQRLTDDRAGVITGVHGLGGIGKTELAFAYAHAYAGVYPGGRFLVMCEGRGSLREAVLQLGDFPDFREQLSDEQRMTPEAYFNALLGCLRRRIDTHGRVLLVLDNVTNLALLSRQQTDEVTAIGPQLHLLATTRLLPPAAEQARWFTLGELPEADALNLLEKHRPFIGPDGRFDEREKSAAQSIVRRLGGFALAVELVAAWLRAHPEISYAHMADGLGLENLETLAGDQNVELRRHNHEKRLAAVLGPVLHSLSPAERRAMEYAAFLAPDAVPIEWLKELTTADFPELAQPSRLSDPWEDLCRRLIQLALLRPSENTGWDDAPASSPCRPAHPVHRVHRLVQDLLRSGLGEAEARRREQAVGDLVKRRDAALKNTSQWQDARWEVEPLDALARRWDEDNHPKAAWLLNQVGTRWNTLAEWSRAEPLFRSALAIFEKSLGENHPEVATALNNLAQLLKATNRLSEAEPLMRRALAIWEKSLGENHPSVATALNNLALLLQATNRLSEAEPLYRRALAILEKSLGENHPDVATALNNLALLLQATNRFSEAEPLMRRALAIDEHSYGENHPKVSIRLNNLAQLLADTNRLSEAEPLMRRALAIDEHSYGENHPDVARDLINLAGLLYATNRLSEAEPLMRRALAIDEHSYGENHPEVATDLNNLAQLLLATNRLSEAEPLCHRALAIDEHSYGENHPNVASALNNLALLLQATNRLLEAEPLFRRALAIWEKSLGENHPSVASALNNLAALLQAMNRLSEAEPLYRRALAIDEHSYGENHPNVASALNNLARLLQATNRLSEAEPLMRRALEIFLQFTRATGHPHPHLRTVSINYAELLYAMGKPEEEIQQTLAALAQRYGMKLQAGGK
jgi:tetratricopeptide (TPR) repeat protein